MKNELRHFKIIKVNNKIKWIFGILICAMILTVVILNLVADMAHKMYKGPYLETTQAIGLQLDINRMEKELRNAVLSQELPRYASKLESLQESIENRIEVMKTVFNGDKQLIADLEVAVNTMTSERNNILEYIEKEEYSLATDTILGRYYVASAVVAKSAGKLYSEADLLAARFDRNAQNLSRFTQIFVILFLVVFLTAAIVFLSIEKQNVTIRSENKTILSENKHIRSGIEYASTIQTNLLPPESEMEKAFAEHSVIWKPRDVVGGDIYWMKRFDMGTVLCVADCTGHGTSGALLTMLVVSVLESVVSSDIADDTAEIILRLEQQLVELFKRNSNGYEISMDEVQDGCDLAVLFIDTDGNVNLSAGHTNVYVCDGKEVRRIKGQRINVGEGKIRSKELIKTTHIPANPDNQFYIASDGLFDQSGQETDEPFGYGTLSEIVLANHGKPLTEVTDIIWNTFEKHRGDSPLLDDLELVAFRTKIIK